MTAVVVSIPLDQIQPHPGNPRRSFDDAALKQLSYSILQYGLIQPIVVRPYPLADKEGSPSYQILAGERRWRAAKLAGLQEIEATIRDELGDDDIAGIQLVENFQREDLSLWEQAQGCAALIEYFQSEIDRQPFPTLASASALSLTAGKLSKSKSWVSKRASVMRMQQDVRDLVESGVIVDVEIAQTIHQINEYHSGIAQALINQAENPERHGGALTRALVAERLAEVKRQHQAKQEAEQAKKTEAEQSHPAAKGDGDPVFTEPTEGEGGSKKARLEKSQQPAETATQRELRLRHQAWEAIIPDCRQFASDWQQAITHSVPIGDDFSLSVDVLGASSKDTEAPETPASAKYVIEMVGSAQDAATIAAAFNEKMLFGPALELTLDELKLIESTIGRPVRIVEHIELNGHSLSAMQFALSGRRAKSKSDSATSSAPEKNSIAEFLSLHTRPAPGQRIQSKELYAAYARWASARGVEPIQHTNNEWGAAIANAGIQKIRSNGLRYLDIAIEGTP